MPVNVSVVLPVYNRTGPLIAAMKSVLDQSYQDLELIVVDDASPIDLEPVVTSLGDSRVRYLRRDTNGGAGAARNTGIAAATAPYIAFQDSDDLWFPEKLATQMKLISEAPPEVGVVMGGKIIYGRDAASRFGEGLVCYAPSVNGVFQPGDDQLKRMLSENRLSVQNAVFRKDCYPGQQWFDESLRADEDWDFAVRLVQHTRIHEVLSPVVMCFKSDDSISKNRRQTMITRARVLKKNRDVCAKYPKEHGKILFRLGTMLYESGRRRTGRRFMLIGIQKDPSTLLRAIRRRLPF